LGKDSIDTTRLAKNKKKLEGLPMNHLSIFTINVAEDFVEFHSIYKESGLYKVLLLDQ
ncbi:14628_t:CDS:1, partial [Racocetra fulgida]